VNISNTSTVVDRYLLEAVDPPPWLHVRSGRTELLPSTASTLTAELRIVSRRLVPAQCMYVVMRVRNTTGHLALRELPVRIVIPVVEAQVELHTEPQLIRVLDASPGVCRVTIRNVHSNRWAQVRLAATDPEQVVRATWNPRQIQVPPGGEARSEVRLDAPTPVPGGEINRTITIRACEGHRKTETTVTLVQSASAAAIDLLSLRLDPSVRRLGRRCHGRLNAVIDNSRGASPVSLHLSGSDPERKIRFAFDPPTIHVPPGRQASAQVALTVPRTAAGEEVIRPLTITASDGWEEIRADGTLIQMATSQRALVRVIVTLIGGLAIILGALLPFVVNSHESAVGLTAAQIASRADARYPGLGVPDHLPAGGFENAVSIGLILIILGGLVILGLTGPTGRMTRSSAVLGLAIAVATMVGLATLTRSSGPDSGAVLVIGGCLVGYAGGLLARR
jgi:hypothetical protein